jgi:hypothetical protein
MKALTPPWWQWLAENRLFDAPDAALIGFMVQQSSSQDA